MIFGKEEKLDNTIDKWFAWRPVKLEDGRFAWLIIVERTWRDTIFVRKYFYNLMEKEI